VSLRTSQSCDEGKNKGDIKLHLMDYFLDISPFLLNRPALLEAANWVLQVQT
jgi:hypothetical protein